MIADTLAKIGNGTRALKYIRVKVRKYQGKICAECLRKCLDTGLTVHHIQAARNGGIAVFGNAVGLCRPCHDEEELRIKLGHGRPKSYWEAQREIAHRMAHRGHA